MLFPRSLMVGIRGPWESKDCQNHPTRIQDSLDWVVLTRTICMVVVLIWYTVYCLKVKNHPIYLTSILGDKFDLGAVNVDVIILEKKRPADGQTSKTDRLTDQRADKHIDKLSSSWGNIRTRYWKTYIW